MPSNNRSARSPKVHLKCRDREKIVPVHTYHKDCIALTRTQPYWHVRSDTKAFSKFPSINTQPNLPYNPMILVLEREGKNQNRYSTKCKQKSQCIHVRFSRVGRRKDDNALQLRSQPLSLFHARSTHSMQTQTIQLFISTTPTHMLICCHCFLCNRFNPSIPYELSFLRRHTVCFQSISGK